MVRDESQQERGRLTAALFLLSLLAGYLFFVLMPFSTFAFGWQDFPQVGCRELACYCGFLALTSSFALFCLLLPIARLRPRVGACIAALLLGGCLAFYAQGNLIGLNYGLLDGTPIPWSEFRLAGWINSVIWVLLLVTPVAAVVVKGLRVVRLISISAFAFFAYTVLIGSYLISSAPSAPVKPARFTLDGMGEFSSERNVIVFVADSFDRGLFDFVLARNPVWRERLAGFSYYHNACGCFVGTNLALPQLVTGETDFRNDDDPQYVRRAYSSAPVLKAAAAGGFEVDLYADFSIGPCLDEVRSLGVFGNAITNEIPFVSQANFTAVSEVISFSLFRYLPHAVKETYWHRLFREPVAALPVDAEDGISYVEVENALAEQLATGNLSLVDQPKLKFFHVKATHAPRFNPEQAERTLELFLQLREKVREAGLEDRTTFIFMADHGFINRDRPVFLIGGEGADFVRCETPFSYRRLSEVFAAAMSGRCQIPVARTDEMRLIPENVERTRIACFDGIGSDFFEDGLELLPTDAEMNVEGTALGPRLVWSGRDTVLSLPLEAAFRKSAITVELSVDGTASQWLDTVTVSALGEPCLLRPVREGVLAFEVDLSRVSTPRNFLMLALKSAARSPLSLSRLSISLTGPRLML